jgi:uncharacterized phage infection (PIP) family protein YhgE
MKIGSFDTLQLEMQRIYSMTNIMTTSVIDQVNAVVSEIRKYDSGFRKREEGLSKIKQ